MSDNFKIDDLVQIRNEFEKLSVPPIIGKYGKRYYKIVIPVSWVNVILQEAIAITEEGELHAEFPDAKYKWREFLIYDYIPYGETQKTV